MYDIYLKQITIDKVRHLENLQIPISEEKKHLILTGKNGSGKTSLLKALSGQLDSLSMNGDFYEIEQEINNAKNRINTLIERGESEKRISEQKNYLNKKEKNLQNLKHGLTLDFNSSYYQIKPHFLTGEFVLAYYNATRKFETVIPKHVEKVQLRNNYAIQEMPSKEFVKYILDLKVTEALLKSSGKHERAERIAAWFVNFEALLKKIFDDASVRLIFDEETFLFTIAQDGKEPFDFNKLSDGFAAILDIVVDLMIRMEKHLNGRFQFDLPGIVLIDEIETHLHLELQKNVLAFLMNLFPNIQFIVSTHSPFILSSAENAVIYDLENHTIVKDGLTDLPYDGIVRGYFQVDDLSKNLRNKYERYKKLISQKEISDDEMEEISKLEFYLDEIPDYLALEISTEYHRLKAKFEEREDL
ncbi:MAG: AAA family ATPase [Lachnospiraceae bacterium]|nr:AAA family ATPase [Lachnospiraceae bacterium]